MIQGFKNLAIASLGISLVLLICATAVPALLSKDIETQVESDTALTQEHYDRWGEVPGYYNITASKSFTLYNLVSDPNDMLVGDMNFEEVGPFTFDYTYKFQNVSYLPNTRDSITFQRIYNLASKDGKNLTEHNLIVPNLGGFQGLTNYMNKTKYEIGARTLFDIYNTLTQDCALSFTAYYMYHFYIGDKTRTYSTIFTNNYANLTSTQSDSIWNDPIYGWSNYTGLTYWALPHYTKKADAHPIWSVLKSKFGLDDKQMNALAGINSIVAEFIELYQSYLKDNFNCMSSPCTPGETLALQWVNSGLSKLGFFGAPAVDSCAAFNSTLPGMPEIAQFTKGNGSLFTIEQVKDQLFVYDDFNNEFSSEATSLINPVTLEFIEQNKDSAPEVQKRLTLTTPEEAQAIIDYTLYVLNDYIKVDASLSVDPTTVLSATVYQESINKAIEHLNTTISQGLPAAAVQDWIVNTKKWTCTQFYDAVSAPVIAGCACGDDAKIPDPTTLDGEIFYLSGLVQMETKGSWDQILKIIQNCPQGFGAMNTLLTKSNLWKDYADGVTKAITRNCPGRCDIYQWATSGVTNDLPTEYFKQNYASVYDLGLTSFNAQFKDSIPELAGYASSKLGQKVSLTQDEVSNLLYNYREGSLMNTYEMIRYIDAVKTNNQAYLKQRFDSSGVADIGKAFVAYQQQLFYNNFVGGLTNNRTAEELIWGYKDDSIPVMMSYGTPIQGFNTYLSSDIGFVGTQNNTAEYHNNKTLLNTMNTGAIDSSLVRQYTSYKASETISVPYPQYFNGSAVLQNYKLNPWNVVETVNGTDGMAFRADLQDDEVVTYFKETYFRNLKLVPSGKWSNVSDYSIVVYKYDEEQFKENPDYHTTSRGFVNLSIVKAGPYVASEPYYAQCDSSVLPNLQINGKSVSDMQSANPLSTEFCVEQMTGYTVSSSDYSLYSLQLRNASYWKELISAEVKTMPVIMESTIISSPSDRYKTDLDSYERMENTRSALSESTLIAAVVFFVASLVFYGVYRKKSNALGESNYNQYYSETA